MSTDDISAMWAEDAKIDESNLAGEAKKIPQLHNKYYTLYYKEALKVKKLRYDYKELELAKREWLDGSMAEEDLKERGWKPQQKKIIRQDLDKHLQADADIIRLSLKIDYHTANADYLEDVVKTIHSRNFIINNMIAVLKFPTWRVLMTKEEAKRKAEFLIERGYVEGKDVDTLTEEILNSINKDVDRGTAIPTDSNTNKE